MIEHSIESIYRIDALISSVSIISALIKTLCVYTKRKKKKKKKRVMFIHLLYVFLSSLMTAFLFIVMAIAYSDDYLHMMISGIVGGAMGSSSIKLIRKRILDK